MIYQQPPVEKSFSARLPALSRQTTTAILRDPGFVSEAVIAVSVIKTNVAPKTEFGESRFPAPDFATGGIQRRLNTDTAHSAVRFR